MKSVTILIPAFNEENFLSETLAEVERLVIHYRDSLSITAIVVDDFSSDETPMIAKLAATQFTWLRVISNPKNLGLGGSYKRGLEESDTEYITWIPADNSHSYESLLPAFDSIGNADIIIPVPSNPSVRPIGRRFISKIYTIFINIITGFDVPYYNGLSIHNINLLRRIRIETDGFGFQAEIIVKLLRNGSTYSFVPTLIGERASGRSKAFSLKNIYRVLKTLKKIACVS